MSKSEQAYISKVHLKGYKSIRDLEIDFKPGLNIIIGPNGSGKTNFLEFLEKALHFEVEDTKSKNIGIIEFYKAGENYRLEYNINPNIKLSLGIDVKIEIFNSKNESILRKAYKKIGNRELYNSNEFSMYSGSLFEMDYDKGEEFKLIGFGISKDFDAFFRDSFSVEFYAEMAYGENSSIDTLFEIIDDSKFNEDKSNVTELSVSPSFLNILNNYSPVKSLKFIIDNAKISQGVHGLNEEYEQHQQEYFEVKDLKIEFLVGNKWLHWEQLSDGTKRIFYILYNIFASRAVSIFLEEPELGIHPDQLYKLMDFIKEQSEEKQIIITTHSPEVLSILNKDEIDRIIVTRYDAEKGTQMHHLSAEKTRKAQIYIEETGDLSSFWVHSNLEEYDAEETEN